MRFRDPILTTGAIWCGLLFASASTVGLVPGVPIERELGGGDTHTYQVTLSAGQYLQILADQRGIDVQLGIFAPDGRIFVSIDNLSATVGPESISILAEVPGVYRLEVTPVNKHAAKGAYQVAIHELRPAVPQDTLRLDAQRVFAEGRELKAQGTAESYGRAREKLEKALILWQTVGDTWHEAVTLHDIGEVDYATGNPKLALSTWDQVCVLWQTLGDIRGEAEALNNLGAVNVWLGNVQRGVEYLRQALPLRQSARDRDGESQTLTNIGSAYMTLGRQGEALQYLDQALSLSRLLGNRSGEAHARHNMASAYASLGETQKALDELNQALEVRRTMGDRNGMAITLDNIGTIHLELGDFEKAMDYYAQALPISREAGAPNVEASVLRNIGVSYRMLADPRKALEYLEHALPIGRASGRRELEASLHAEMAAAYADVGDKPTALTYYSQALQSYRTAGRTEGEVMVLTQTGLLWADSGDTEKALATLNSALTLSRSIRYKHGEARALCGLARVERDGGRLNEARIHLEAAIPIIESLRTVVASDDLRTSYLALNRKHYELYIDVLMCQQQVAAAFEASERARARSLLESVAEAHADIRQGVDPALLERERSLTQRLDARERYRMQLLSRMDRAEQVNAVENELTALLYDYQEIRARIRATSPHYAAFTQPQPLTLKEIQQQVLDKDTMLLEYMLGDDRSYLWAVTSVSIESFDLPSRAEVETTAKRAYELLKTSHRREFERQTQLVLAGLSRMLLGPAAGWIGHKRLLIVSDGALQYIPFEALTEPAAVTSNPLVVDHEIVNLPSASVLAVLRREVGDRKPAAKTVAILSDPVFEAHDPRVQEPKGSLTKVRANPVAKDDELSRRELTRSATDSGVVRFERLPFSRREAESVAALIARGKVMKAVDFSASKATATSAEISQFRIVHFATHGLINSQHPELSGIVLSLVDEQGRPQDGFLRAHEIYNLKLGAELAVLSACQTALGKEVKGEGLMGLARGFMYAGVSRVVASLWDVKDQATAELMRRFYRGMLQENLRPAAALRAAQVSMWKEKRWEAPYYWAPFVIQGEWK
jgi:CHAT domain-containing protein/Tfp pilus assembly protein PilF